MVREHWLNAEFDLSLRPGGTIPEGLRGQVAELRSHAAMAAEEGDSVVVEGGVVEDFLASLQAAGLVVPTVVTRCGSRADREFAPWGWNAQAVERKRLYDAPTPHPPLDVVRRVNGRRFSFELEQAVDRHTPGLEMAWDVAAVERVLARAPEDGVVVKAEHANAGVGNRRMRGPTLGDIDRRWLERTLAAGPVAVERWLTRTADLCTVFRVGGQGLEAGTARVHRALHTADGAFVGALYGSQHPFREQLADAAARAGRALAGAGYFGPVCLDSFVWDDGGTARLRPVVEVNARRHVSEGWARLHALAGGVLLGHHVSLRRFDLPEATEVFAARLGRDAWRADVRRGVFATTPLRLPEGGRPRRVAVAFCGESVTEVEAIQERFRTAFERSR